MRACVRAGIVAGLFLAAAAAVGPRAAGRAYADDGRGLELFESRVRPLLVERCQECHATGRVTEGGFAVDSRAALRRGGRGGAAVVPGDPAASRLLAILRHEIPGLEMPEGGERVDDATLAAVAEWIALGAPDPRDDTPGASPAIPVDFAERRRWWSFQPLARPEPPAARLPEWDSGAIDRFLLAGIDRAGLEPAPLADPATRLRRLSFVLTGLPPEPDEVVAFVADPSADAWERAIDRMLASPRFGERFARHWMDLVRYAESHGSQGDPELAEAWRYRDWLVRAFNTDLPYDRFVREQIAGDLLPDPRRGPDGLDESAIGPAHLRMTELGFVPVDALDDQVKVVENQIDVYSKTFFGLTAACARCHDHKFDPVTQDDFYALYGIFASSRPGHVILDPPESLRAGETEMLRLRDSIRAELAGIWLGAAEGFATRLVHVGVRMRRAAEASEALARSTAAVAAIEGPARLRALERRGAGSPPAALPSPIARWSFTEDARDSVGGLAGELLGGAVVRDGRLHLDGVRANVRTAPLREDLREKTLEAWVALANLEQRGGGVIGLEVPEGRFFDSIVFGEMKPGHWLPGSDFFNRTQDPAGPSETAGPAEFVHVAITWSADGRICVYRDGVPHGTPYTKGSPQAFAAGKSRFLFGQRLSDIDPPLAGVIDEARAYDRALTADEVAASFRAGPEGVSEDELLASLDDTGRAALATLRAERDGFARAIRELAPPGDDPLARVLAAAAATPASPLHAWARLLAAPDEARGAIATACVDSLEAERRSIAAANAGVTRLWDLRGGDHAAWFGHGTGVPEAPAANGAIAILPDGDRVVGGILAAGIHTHLLGHRRPAVYQSPRFVIDTDNVWLRVHGRKSVARLVIENYPLGNGGIYPAVRPERDDAAWIRLDTNYRRGSTAYVELATDVADGAVFGIAEVAAGNGAEPPRDGGIAAAPFLAGGLPSDPDALAIALQARLVDTLRAWRDGRLADDGRALLDFFVRERLLPVAPDASPALEALVDRYRALARAVPLPTRAPGVLEARGYDQPRFIRGQHTRPAERVPRRGLSLFGTEPYAPRADGTRGPSGRLQLADEATGPARDLLARVMVNRLWRHVFGRGIVATTDNFGRLGEPPSNPELLDWLAGRFIDEGWSVKRALKRMVGSRAFQLASRPTPRAAEADPLGALLSHFPVRRLDAESIRDSILAASGQLDLSMGGPGVDPWHASKTEGGGPPGPLDGARRRSLYLRTRRNACNPFLEVFDAPKPTTTRGTRDVTGGPVQALAMLNDPFVADQAAKWGARVADDAASDEARVRGMILQALSRLPESGETADLLAALAGARTAFASLPDGTARPADEAERLAWSELAHAILCLEETIHVE